MLLTGFDSAHGDPLGGCHVTPNGYAHMTSLLRSVTERGRVVVALEGGYNLVSIATCMEAVHRTLLGKNLIVVMVFFVNIKKKK